MVLVRKTDRTKIAIRDVVSGHNFREYFETESLKESMSKVGLLHPIVITSDNILVAGARRLKAARELGWEEIPCRVLPFANEQSVIAAGVFENIRRESFTKSEKLRAMAWLKEHWQANKEVTTKKNTGRGRKKDAESLSFSKKAARETNQSESAVKEQARIGKEMTDAMTTALDDGTLTQKQAAELIRIPDPERRDALLAKVAGKSLRDTKKLLDAELGSRAPSKRKVRRSDSNDELMTEDQWVKILISNLKSISERILNIKKKSHWRFDETLEEPLRDAAAEAFDRLNELDLIFQTRNRDRMTGRFELQDHLSSPIETV